ncbi:nitrogenase cofactor biosynthesis protein NifB [Paenibacillus tepidiphilus]|uniref:nitrogenase cofactor biosynthesis protein NifB n=1 Tax=Paenibacillus tepidiphilus TaxID=2608683 RepID=UPI001EF1417B|nr:nitrogenase cofactor biosynthesis protein NifB [Paenibacillus tepidiphilus]
MTNTSRHPCYDEMAHHYFARMHVAVAPKCNINCNYCNIKYDCVSESRPGVVSKVLSPHEAYNKVRSTLVSLPQLTVVGIAGPGDPLANPQETFETFRLLSEGMPDLQLCLSTNGLKLPDYTDEIVRYGIGHVTVTVNAVDPHIGAEVYRAVFFRGKAYRGLAAAELLLQNQLEGIRRIAERGVKVKVNSVLIPGVNDSHLLDVTETVKDAGAFSHNIMPLILSPGSLYEAQGRTEPAPSLALQVQARSEAVMPVMRHCRQCRADAVGLLGDDLGWKGEALPGREYDPAVREEVLLQLDQTVAERRQRENDKRAEGERDALRIAVTTRGGGQVNVHFGHAREFLVYEVSGQEQKLLGVRRIQAYCNGKADCGDASKEDILEETITLLQDCHIVLCAAIGPGPAERLARAGLTALARKGEIGKLLEQCAKYNRYFTSAACSPVGACPSPVQQR